MFKLLLISILFSNFLFASSSCQKDQCQAVDVVSFLGYKIYTATFTSTKDYESMLLKYHISIPKEKNNKKVFEKFEQNNKINNTDFNKLSEWTSKTIDATDGSTYFVKVTPRESILQINGKSVLSFNDGGDFGKKFLKIWTGDNPVDENFKKEILSLNPVKGLN